MGGPLQALVSQRGVCERSFSGRLCHPLIARRPLLHGFDRLPPKFADTVVERTVCGKPQLGVRPFSVEDRTLMKKVKIVTQLDKLPRPCEAQTFSLQAAQEDILD
mmetsp:Transcript_116693/g.267834  ORF Transcript_116693/g.267834 Transcript_116693/m.267834 type:complete len:105 (-) Transcript_116693:200-514(-)